MRWQANSPDLNPIENLRREFFKKCFMKKLYPPKKDLLTAIQQNLDHFDKEYCFNLVKSMPEKIMVVVKDWGGSMCLVARTTWLPVSRRYKRRRVSWARGYWKISVSSKTNYGRDTHSARLIILVGLYHFSEWIINSISLCISSLPRYNSQ